MVGVTPPVQVKVLRNGVRTMEYRVVPQDYRGRPTPE